MKTVCIMQRALLGILLVVALWSEAQGQELGGSASDSRSSCVPALKPLPRRVNIQMDSARLDQVIDGCWVAVGTRKVEAIQHDFSRPYQGRPSYRFALGEADNTLQGYAPGETKGRAELAYCYALSSDFASLTATDYEAARRMKTVYHHGKGISPQASSRIYHFAVWVPRELSEDVCTIFAQWHGMPDRRLTQNPEGEIRMLSREEFLALESRMVFKKEKGYDKLPDLDKQGRQRVSKEPNGWKVEQGGYPPLAFGFSNGYFYIKANSDRRWLTDKDDRCNASVVHSQVLVPVTSEYKASTIACRMPMAEFPREEWVEFTVAVTWSAYGGESEELLRPGELDVVMRTATAEKHLVDHALLPIGRNDDAGYYFKFGIYRVAGSTVPVCYNLAGYREESPDTMSTKEEE